MVGALLLSCSGRTISLSSHLRGCFFKVGSSKGGSLPCPTAGVASCGLMLNLWQTPYGPPRNWGEFKPRFCPCWPPSLPRLIFLLLLFGNTIINCVLAWVRDYTKLTLSLWSLCHQKAVTTCCFLVLSYPGPAHSLSYALVSRLIKVLAAVRPACIYSQYTSCSPQNRILFSRM